ncbi:ATP-binding protein [Flavobacteriaceae bacterium 3-367]
MKSKDLLSHLSDLESKLSDFSFEELTTDEAATLRKTFLSFRAQVEAQVFGEKTPITLYKKTPAKETSNTEGMLVANVSHEIRTPLNGIIGFTDLLRESKLTKSQLTHVNAIQSASRTLLDIINELLEYSKLSAGLEQFESVHFNFSSVIRDVAYLCNTLILEKKVTLEVNINPAIPEVLIGDPSKLSQILLNLMGNAIKFVEQGEIHLRVAPLKTTEGEVLLEFEVADTGIGIPEEKLEHIFDSFKQAESDTFAKYGGSGLGLSIVKKIIENLNGTVEVSSTLGVGTTFTFTLPYGKGKQSPKPRKKNIKAPQQEAKAQLKGLRILVFEDNLLNQRLIEQRLKTWGCKPYITDNPHYGLNILEKSKFDLVLMDLRMPVMNGFEVTQKIRSHKSGAIRSIPIIALTADFTVRDKEQCAKTGINDYILKPYAPEELMQKLLDNKKGITTLNSKMSTSETQETKAEEQDSIMDLSDLLEDCGGELELLQELVRLYKQNALEFIGNVKLHLKNQDFEGLEFASHKIKSGLAMMQTYGLHKIAVKIHQCSKTDRDMAKLQTLYDRFLEEYPIVETAMEQELKKLKRNS